MMVFDEIRSRIRSGDAPELPARVEPISSNVRILPALSELSLETEPPNNFGAAESSCPSGPSSQGDQAPKREWDAHLERGRRLRAQPRPIISAVISEKRLLGAVPDDKMSVTFDARSAQAQRMENLGQLAGGVAHDFNNLLGVILNYASFVAEDLSAATEQDWLQRVTSARGDLAQVTLAAQRAANLTRQLLAFARQEVIRPQVLDLDQVIASVEEMLHLTIGDRVEMVTSLAGDLWPVLADSSQLQRVLVNLVVNARDAMPDGGTLTIDTRNVDVDAAVIAGGSNAREGKNVRVRVSDTGTGISADVIDHVFEPFFTTKGVDGGTGLGLSTVYGILSQADGQIEIHSEMGGGTTVSMTFPVTAEAASTLTEPPALRRSPEGETVLVVEDESALRDVTDRILSRNGYRVLLAATGQEALQIARDHVGDIHLLITDVVMPQMLGIEVAERIRAIEPGIAVLFMSGYARPVLASQGRLDMNVALVEKPFSEAELLDHVGQVLNGHFRGFTTIEVQD